MTASAWGRWQQVRAVWLVAAALLLRALVPAGYMIDPGRAAHAAWPVIVCPDVLPAAAPPAAPHMAHGEHGAHGAGEHHAPPGDADDTPHQQGAKTERCAFAGLGAPLLAVPVLTTTSTFARATLPTPTSPAPGIARSRPSRPTAARARPSSPRLRRSLPGISARPPTVPARQGDARSSTYREDIMPTSASGSGGAARAGALYRAVWRWHFYAGLLLIPFVLLLATTGGLYLFKPQIDAALDAPYRDVMSGPHIGADAEITAALATDPRASLDAYVLPRSAGDAGQVLLTGSDGTRRVYVDPASGRVLASVREESRPTELLRRIHGTLLVGTAGSVLVELAASWAFVMLATGLYLWWPRGRSGAARLLYPRRGRLFWRDLHAVTGVWVSGFALLLLLTALPWTTVWGEGFKRTRALVEPPRQDWSAGFPRDAHAGHEGHAIHRAAGGAVPLETIVAQVRPLGLGWPVHVMQARDGVVVAAGLSQRPSERATLRFDAATGRLLSRETLADKPAISRVVQLGIALHEGQLFGLPNQLLGLATALGLIALCVSAVVLWWRRRPEQGLGAPPALPDARLAGGLALLIGALALFLPLLGASLLAVALVERLLLRRWRAAAPAISAPAPATGRSRGRRPFRCAPAASRPCGRRG